MEIEGYSLDDWIRSGALLYLFNSLSPEKKQEIRDVMNERMKELAKTHIEDITNHLLKDV